MEMSAPLVRRWRFFLHIIKGKARIFSSPPIEGEARNFSSPLTKGEVRRGFKSILTNRIFTFQLLD